MFEMLASYFLKQGYYVSGAAFDSDIKLAHRIIKSENELNPLLKSKYVQSDMSGVYQKILGLLKDGNKVFFCGTPCQVSALLNSVSSNKLKMVRCQWHVYRKVEKLNLFKSAYYMLHWIVWG